MTKALSLPIPKVPAVARSLIRPMFFLALGLHALVLFTPFPKAPEKPPESKEAPVKITQLPTTRANTNQSSKAAAAKPKPALPRINRPNSNAIVPRSIEPPRQVEPSAPESNAPPRSQPASNNAGTATTADFPHYNPSTPNCFNVGLGENCRVAIADLNTVAAFYLSAPKAKGFILTPDEQSADKKIYTVTTPDKKTLFLHLFTDASSTVILLSESKVPDLAKLKGSVNIPAEYYSLLTELAPPVDRSDNPQTNAQPEQFPRPELFFNVVSAAELQSGTIPETRPGIDGSPTLILGQSPSSFFDTLSQAGLSGTFQVTKAGQYGGGDVYQLKKDNTTFFMNLVPTKDNRGTIVVTWLRNPGS